MKNLTATSNGSWLTLVILAAMLLAACGGSQEAPVVVHPGAQAGDLVGLEPCTFEAGDVEYAADCGTLVVPENRSDPDSRLIALPVTRVLATDDDPAEPVFRLNGGPGISNMNWPAVAWLIEKHDVVLVGYRGVDGTVRLDCPEVSQHIRNLPGDILSEESLAGWSDAYAACASRLQSEGVDIDGYTVVEVVDDLEDARLALGFEQINLYSGSYGTRLAMIYAWRYPESIYRSAMVGVNPPGRMYYYDPAVVDAQLEYYSELCTANAECSARTDNLAETIRSVYRDAPERWLGLPIDVDMSRVASFESLSAVGEAPLVFDVWLAAGEGDYSGMVLLTLGGSFLFAEATVWGDNVAKAASADLEDTQALRDEMNLSKSIMGTPRTELVTAAEGWPANTIPAEYRQVQPSDVETLLVSGNIDMWTPAQYAEEELLPFLSNGQHVVLSESGHGEMMRRQPEAAAHLLNTFYDTGVGDDSMFVYKPWEFKVGLGFPLMAKLGLAIVALVVVGLVVLVRYVVRRVRRRRAAQAT